MQSVLEIFVTKYLSYFYKDGGAPHVCSLTAVTQYLAMFDLFSESQCFHTTFFSTAWLVHPIREIEEDDFFVTLQGIRL